MRPPHRKLTVIELPPAGSNTTGLAAGCRVLIQSASERREGAVVLRRHANVSTVVPRSAESPPELLKPLQ